MYSTLSGAGLSHGSFFSKESVGIAVRAATLGVSVETVFNSLTDSSLVPTSFNRPDGSILTVKGVIS